MDIKSDSARFERYKQCLLDIINKELPGCKVYLFGSRARGDFDSGADIDLALDAERCIDFKIIYEIKNKIEDTTIPLNVDVVDINSVSASFRNEIMKDWILWKK